MNRVTLTILSNKKKRIQDAKTGIKESIQFIVPYVLSLNLHARDGLVAFGVAYQRTGHH